MHLPGDWKTDHDDIQMAQEQFILALEEVCACRRVDVKIEELWKSQSPLLREVDFYEYCHTVSNCNCLTLELSKLENSNSNLT